LQIKEKLAKWCTWACADVHISNFIAQNLSPILIFLTFDIAILKYTLLQLSTVLQDS